MRDINFFKPYLRKREIKFDKRIIYVSLFSLILILFVGYSVLNAIKINNETKAVAKLRFIVEDKDTIAKVEKIKAKEIEVQNFKESVGKIRILDESIMAQDVINEELLEIINLRMPENLILTYLSVDNPTMEMQGVAEDKYSIAEFQEGLKDIDNCQDVFVSNIKTEEGYYSFTITITLKDVNYDGEEANN